MINIAFNIDENYLDKVKTVMKSVVENTSEDVTFHIVGAIVEDDRFNIKCYTKPELGELDNIKVAGHLSKASLFRALLPEILEIDKVIYLDCDLIVLGDLADLNKYKVNYIAGCVDPMWKSQAKKNNLTHTYINTGVLVMNLQKLREINFVGQCREVAQQDYNFSLMDQDLINIVLKDEIEHLPAEWNVFVGVYEEMTRKMLEARNNPKIIHWCGKEKPWNTLDVPFKDKYLRYVDN